MGLEELVVLGIIPGTNIHVGFLDWAASIAAIALVAYSVRHVRRAHTLRFLLIRVSLRLTVAMRRLQRA